MGWRKQDRDWEAIKAGEKKTMRCSVYGAEGGGVQGAVHLWLSQCLVGSKCLGVVSLEAENIQL